MPVPVISSTGISIASYTACLSALQSDYQSIYGSDAEVDASDIDGQLLAVFAQAYFDLTQIIQNTYNNFGVLTAQGAFLDNAVALNDITRNVASASTATVTIIGQAGTVITNGQIGDNLGLGTVWALPSYCNYSQCWNYRCNCYLYNIGSNYSFS